MNTLAALPHSPSSRYVGIGFVVALHVVAVIAISKGLIHKTTPPPPPTVLVDIPKVDPPLPPPPQPMPRLQLNLSTPDPIPVPVPDVPVVNPPPEQIVTQSIDTAAPPHSGPAWTAAVQAPVSTVPPPAGAVCTKMPAPEVPPLNWSGDALFRVVASTQGGRVNALTIQALHGGMDSRTLRTVKAAIERTLREGYECPGNVQFTQEFQFRIE